MRHGVLSLVMLLALAFEARADTGDWDEYLDKGGPPPAAASSTASSSNATTTTAPKQQRKQVAKRRVAKKSRTKVTARAKTKTRRK